MSLSRWLSVILMMGVILALGPLGAQAEPYPPLERYSNYHHPHGNAYGWQGPRPHDFDRHQEYCRHYWRGPYNRGPYMYHAGPPPVAYVAPVTPIFGIQPYPQPQPFFSPPASPGFHGEITF